MSFCFGEVGRGGGILFAVDLFRHLAKTCAFGYLCLDCGNQRLALLWQGEEESSDDSDLVMDVEEVPPIPKATRYPPFPPPTSEITH